MEHTRIDCLDFASPVSGLGSKMGTDATNKWPGGDAARVGEADVDGKGGGGAAGGAVCGVGAVRLFVMPSQTFWMRRLVKGAAQRPRQLAVGGRRVKALQFAVVLGLNRDIGKASSLQDMLDLSNKRI